VVWERGEGWRGRGIEEEQRRSGRKGEGEGKEVVKVGFWNVAGIGNKDREFWRGIESWDIVVLMETWVEGKRWEKE